MNRVTNIWVVASTVLAILGCASQPTHAQFIGLYTSADPPPLVVPDPVPPDFNPMSLPTLTATPLYIVAHTTGSADLDLGIVGAEFGVTGVPGTDDLIITVQANPAANVVIGDPFAGGANIGFPTCVPATANQAILLYSAELVALNPIVHVTLSVAAHVTPSNPNFPFPFLLDCDSLIFPWFRVETAPVPIVINPNVAVESSTWAAIKTQYR